MATIKLNEGCFYFLIDNLFVVFNNVRTPPFIKRMKRIFGCFQIHVIYWERIKSELTH